MVTTNDEQWMVSAGGGDFVPVPEGLHEATIKEITPPVLEDDRYNPGKQKKKVIFIYEVGQKAPNGEEMTVRRKYTFSTNPKSNMRPDVEAIIGRKLTAEEEGNFDIRGLVDRACKVLVKHTPREEGGVWANVSQVLTSDDVVPF
jgi:hypothetical protein